MADDVLLIGGALPPSVVETHPRVSAAAAKWQISLAHALADSWGAHVTCLSYLQSDTYATSEAPLQHGRVHVIPIERPFKRGSVAIYGARMLQALTRIPKPTRVICYNPLIWTAPFAQLAAASRSAKSLVVLADFAADDEVSGLRRVNVEAEKRLLHTFDRVLLLSPGGERLLQPRQHRAVFNGAVDEWALAQPPVVFDGPPRFVYSGAVDASVGVGVFIDAARLAHSRGHPAEFHIFGRGDLGAVTTSPPPNIHYHGFVSQDELGAFLGRNVVCVNPRPPHVQGNIFNTPYKLIMYLSRGAPVITTRTAGVPEDLERACHVVGPSADELAIAIEDIFTWPAERLAHMGAEGRAVIGATRSPATLARVIADLFDR